MDGKRGKRVTEPIAGAAQKSSELIFHFKYLGSLSQRVVIITLPTLLRTIIHKQEEKMSEKQLEVQRKPLKDSQKSFW